MERRDNDVVLMILLIAICPPILLALPFAFLSMWLEDRAARNAPYVGYAPSERVTFRTHHTRL